MKCPDDDALAELLASPSSDVVRAELLAHLDECETCRTLVADAVSLDNAGDIELGRGDTVGRYVIERVIGTGAMGVVYAARDPQLARDVALKVLRPGIADRDALLREARTLARVSHPAVVAIHDASTDDGRLVIAMELVDGVTLRSWLAVRRRTWAELREVFVQAARGLIAAHQTGVIHRDIKPDNILVARDGRVRVTDFGLARTATDARVIAGTPAYMSPEQAAGRDVDARSDLYSLCVVVFEALFERRPAPDENIPTTRRDLPAAMRVALAAGLRADRDDRPAGLEQLVRAMEPRRRPAWIAAAAAAALAVIVTLVARSHAPEPCSDAASAWGDVWHDRDRAAVRAAFAATKLPSAEAAFANVDARLDAYRRRWIETHHATCLATVHGEQSAALLDRRMACLATRKKEVASVAALLATADRELVDRAGDQVIRVSPPSSCTDPAAGELAPPPPGVAARSQLDQLDAQAATARAQQEAGRSAACLATLAPTIEPARTLGYQPLLARLLYTRARCEAEDAKVIEDLDASAAAAIAGHDDETLAWAWIRMIYVEGWVHHDFTKSAHWERYAQALLARGTVSNPRVTLGFYNNAALALQAQGRMDEAREMQARRRTLVVAAEGPTSTSLTAIEEAIGNTYLDEWRFTEALEHYRGAESMIDPALPSIAARLTLLQNEAAALRGVGRSRDALALFPQIFSLLADKDPAGDDSFARALYADALRDAGDATRALAEHVRAATTCERFLGEHAYRCARAWEGEGRDLLALGRTDDAIQPLEHALALGDDEPDAAFVLAQALLHRDRARARTLAATSAARMRELVSKHHADHARLDEIEAWQRTNDIKE
jgi:tetratricopeptide (TPR) repeat protein/predicted Ser/Thr protein kinase